MIGYYGSELCTGRPVRPYVSPHFWSPGGARWHAGILRDTVMLSRAL
jgi:hypothetical protein